MTQRDGTSAHIGIVFGCKYPHLVKSFSLLLIYFCFFNWIIHSDIVFMIVGIQDPSAFSLSLSLSLSLFFVFWKLYAWVVVHIDIDIDMAYFQSKRRDTLFYFISKNLFLYLNYVSFVSPLIYLKIIIFN